MARVKGTRSVPAEGPLPAPNLNANFGSQGNGPSLDQKGSSDHAKPNDAGCDHQGSDQAVPKPWSEFLSGATEPEIRERFVSDVRTLVSNAAVLHPYTVLALFEPEDSIGSFDLDQIYTGLSRVQARERDVLLLLLSGGGGIESAYQISKLCKAHAKEKFVVAIPRQAKSAATLIALGADEIHMGPLGQLGPIDPQLGGLPALGVTQALRTIASLAEQYPGSGEMFARYLRMALTVEQIGYCDRVSASAVQYAERLLSTKALPATKAAFIANELVYEYKDHGFVIDLDEAQKHLGNTWIKTGTEELVFAESLYRHFDLISLLLRIKRSKRLMLIGSLAEPVVIILDARPEG